MQFYESYFNKYMMPLIRRQNIILGTIRENNRLQSKLYTIDYHDAPIFRYDKKNVKIAQVFKWINCGVFQ